MSPFRRAVDNFLQWFLLLLTAGLVGFACWLAVVLLFVLGG